MMILQFKTPSLPFEFETIDRKDEAELVNELLGEPDLLTYGYTIEETGAVGISYRGAQALASQIGGIVTDTPHIYCTPHAYHATVAATNLQTKCRLCGSSSHDRFDAEGMAIPFAELMAIGKATRNAILKVIPESLIQRFLSEWIASRDECNEQAHRQARAICDEISQFAKTKRPGESGDGVEFDPMEAYLCIVGKFGEAVARQALDEVIWRGVPRWRRNFHYVSRPQMVSAWRWGQRYRGGKHEKATP